MKRILALWLCATLVLGPLPRVTADDSDIFSANVQPNILIFLDSSGSMDDYIDQAAEAPYNPALTYTASGSGLPKSAGKVYRCRAGYTIDQCENDASRYVVYKDSVALVPNADPPASASAARDSLSTAGKWNGKVGGTSLQLRTGNYLNYHFSPAGGHENKITVAKRVLINLINNTDGVRFGLARFTGNTTQGPGGAAIVADVGSSKAALINAINMITPSGYTPLKGALEDMGSYYKGDLAGKTSPIQYECQPNYVLMMSDGLQNGYGDLRDEATLRQSQDHRLDLVNKQNIIVDTIGFAIPAGEAEAANDVLRTAARNGGGQFYSTTSERDLENALEDSLRRITTATYAFSTPVIPTTSASGLTRTYMAAFQTEPSRPFWKGYLNAYDRDSTGQVPTDADGVPLNAPAWEAGQKLTEKAAADRTIYTLIGGARESFAKGNANLTTGLLGVGTSAERDKVIDFIRGVDVNDENGDSNTTDDRPWKLGDIYHSTPVVVTPPFQPSTDTSYQSFRTGNAGRTTVILAGANDGMLHAFRESDGVELWAFIPPDLLAKLKGLAATSGDHQFLLDSSPVAADVKIGGAWKTIVIFGERRGGARYHALDITDPTNPQYLWGFTDPDGKIVETWSEPIIGKVKMHGGTGGSERYVAIFGGGYDTANNNGHGKAIFALDVATGTKLWEYYNPGGTSDDRQYMNFSIPANPLALDLNNDGYLDHVYIGDVGGQLWKFDLSAEATLSGGTSGTITNWAGKRFFRAGSDANPPGDGEHYPSQAIYSSPIAAFDSTAKLWIYFGTGDRNHPLNATTIGGSSGNRFYGVKDEPYTDMTNGSVKTDASLGMVNATGLTTAPALGWYYELSGTNKEKVLARADIFNRVVYFTTFLPAGSTTCGGGGVSRLYAVMMTTAYAAIDWSTGEAYPAGSLNSTNARYKTVGAGIASMPIVTTQTTQDSSGAATMSAQVVVGGSGSGPSNPVTLTTNPAVPPDFTRRILYWMERF